MRRNSARTSIRTTTSYRDYPRGVSSTSSALSNGGFSSSRSSSSSSSCAIPSSTRYTNTGSLASLVLEADELNIITQLKDILESYPNKGPPEDPTQLCSHVYIGNQRNAEDFGALRRLGITHVINCCANRKVTFHLNPYPRITSIFRYLPFPAEDHSDYRMLQHVPEAVEFLDHCKRTGGRALVHCNLGINRSGAICAAYLMLEKQITLLEVGKLLKKKRSVVLTNKGFRRQLVKFARAHNLLDPALPSRGPYVSRTGSVSTISSYSDHSNDIPPGELGSSRPISRTNSTSSVHKRSLSSGASFERTPYRPSLMAKGLGSFPPIEETHSAPPTPTRFHPAYSSLPRHIGGSSGTGRSASSSSISQKRTISASHYDQDYFMDPIPEDNHGKKLRHPREAATASKDGDKAFTPSRHYLVNLPKLKSLKGKDKEENLKNKVIKEDAESEWVISSTRPLRIYRRSKTDSVLYQKPSTQHAYKRADTVATTDLATGMDKMKIDEEVEVEMNERLSKKHRSSSRTSLTSLSSLSSVAGFFNKLKSKSRLSLQNF